MNGGRSGTCLGGDPGTEKLLKSNLVRYFLSGF